MSRLINTRRIGFLTSLALMLVTVLGCSADTPTAPDQVPGPPPTTGGNNWKITVSVDPDVLEVAGGLGAGGLVPATVSIDVESRADGSNPVNGTTMSVSTTLGELGALGSGVTAVAVVIDRGKASVLLYPGAVVAAGTVTARLEGSTGRDGFEVVPQMTPFVTAVSPNSGSESGGSHVSVIGTGFQEPLRVRFGEFYGTVTSVTETEIRVITPPASGPLNSDGCGVGGTEYFPTPFDVTVEFGDGSASAALSNAFFYTPDNTGCIGG